MQYIKNIPEQPQFYASYGSFMHKLLELYYKGELTKEEMQMRFLSGFSKEVLGQRPPGSTVQKFIQQGIQYLREFEPFPYEPVAIEQKMSFKIGDFPFVGFIDYLGERDGELYIIDNKSKELKPRSKRKKPTQNDAELDEMLKQLYIYSAGVKQIYGKFPKSLCFNCFRANQFIEEPFNEETYNETVDWAVKSIEDIQSAEDFNPYVEFFSCKFICGYGNECCYWLGR